MEIQVVGHKNPDTDSVCSAIALADLKTKLGVKAVPRVQGKLNNESKFVLKHFNVSEPEMYKKNGLVMLVDHTEKSQSVDNIEDVEIITIVDHHKLGDVTTDKPLEMWVQPVGCTCTIIKKMYDYNSIKIEKNIAGLMLSAILSDTVIFKSATTTEEDKKAANELAKIAGVKDVKAFGMEMFKVKSDFKNASVEDLVFKDYKDFNMNGKKVGVGQLEVIDITLLEDKKQELYEKLKEVKKDKHTVMLMLTDIMKEGTELLVVTDDSSIIKKAFGKELKGESVWLEGVMSRKKQIIPYLEKAL